MDGRQNYGYWTNGYVPPVIPPVGLPGHPMVPLDAMNYPSSAGWNFPGSYPNMPYFPGHDVMPFVNYGESDPKAAMETMMRMNWQNMIGGQAMMMALGAMYNQAVTDVAGHPTNQDPPPGYVWAGPNELLYVGTNAKTNTMAGKPTEKQATELWENKISSPNTFFNSQCSSDCSSSAMDWNSGCSGGSCGSGGETVCVMGEKAASVDSYFNGCGFLGEPTFGKTDEEAFKENVTSTLHNWANSDVTSGTPVETSSEGTRGSQTEQTGHLKDWLVDFGGFGSDSIEYLMSASDTELGI